MRYCDKLLPGSVLFFNQKLKFFFELIIYQSCWIAHISYLLTVF